MKLTDNEQKLLEKMASKPNQQLSLTIDKPNSRIINSLVRKGMAKDIMGTFWSITDAGRRQVTEPKPIKDNAMKLSTARDNTVHLEQCVAIAGRPGCTCRQIEAAAKFNAEQLKKAGD